MTCTHHYLFEEQAGTTSLGRCKRCGATKEGNNVYVGDRDGFSLKEFSDAIGRTKHASKQALRQRKAGKFT